MRKTYITNISLQAKGDLLKLLYESKGFTLTHNRETSFPIIPVIADHEEAADEVTVLAVRPDNADNADTPDNYAAFLKELAQLGIGEDQVKVISVAENQSDTASFELLMRIIEEIPDESLAYGDITFGTKPMSAILLYALSFIPKIKNCEVDGIYYGEVKRVGGEMPEALRKIMK